MRPAEPFPQVRNLVVLGLKLRRLALQFGLEPRQVATLRVVDFSGLSLGHLGTHPELWAPQWTAIGPSLPGLLAPG